MNVRDVEEPVAENEKNVAPEQQLGEDGAVDDNNKEEAAKEAEEKEPEDKVTTLSFYHQYRSYGKSIGYKIDSTIFLQEMTLKEYEKLREESRKLLAKTELRKAEVDEELENMQQLSCKKSNDEIFAKLVTSYFLLLLQFLHFSSAFV